MKLAQDIAEKKDHKAKLESRTTMDKKAEQSQVPSFCAWSPRREEAQQCGKAPLWSRRDLAWPPTYWT